MFSASLGAFNGLPARNYSFRTRTASSTTGSYNSIMIAGCNEYAMKPVCVTEGHCRNDAAALYLGQQASLGDPAYRTPAYSYLYPSGWPVCSRALPITLPISSAALNSMSQY